MEQAIGEFLAYLAEAEKGAENTILAYRTDLEQFRRAVASGLGRPASLDVIDGDAARVYVSWLRSRGYRPSTVSRKMAAVRSFVAHTLPRHGRSPDSVLSVLQPPPASGKKARVLSRQEVHTLIHAPQERGSPRDLRDSAILALLYATGLRAAEVVGLTLNHVDLEAGHVRLPGEESPRPLGGALEHLKRYLNEGRPLMLNSLNEWALFLNQRGGSLSRQGLWLVVKRWARKAGLGHDVSPHTLRRTLGAHMVEEGYSRREVRKKLGLSSSNSLRATPPKGEPGEAFET